MEMCNQGSYMQLLSLLLAVIKPTEVKSVKEVQSVVEDWENKLARLEEEYGEKINDNHKVAILIAMLPETSQEKILELEKGAKGIKYDKAYGDHLFVEESRAEEAEERRIQRGVKGLVSRRGSVEVGSGRSRLGRRWRQWI